MVLYCCSVNNKKSLLGLKGLKDSADASTDTLSDSRLTCLPK